MLDFVHYLLRYILNELDLLPDNIFDWVDLTEVLNKSLSKPTIILMDNIEKGLQLPALDERFWWNMRFLANHGAKGNLGFCVFSDQPFDGFGNTFNEFQLGPLIEEEARELLNSAPEVFSQVDTEWILEKSQCWPVLLQELCRVRLESEGGDDWRQIGLKRRERYSYLLS